MLGKKKRKLVFLKSCGRCARCECILHNDVERYKDRFYMQVDHILPQSIGGTSDIENLRAICKSCNSKKNNISSRNLIGNIQRKLDAAELEPLNFSRILDDYKYDVCSEEEILEVVRMYDDFLSRNRESLQKLLKELQL